ncbi:WD40/YVTN/BNR-like repeat-containing protein [Zooshikella sp. RANM57]|uniref:WD40/YVTN/BNR-like repeat-containing protein n=1 Tax=Zooshikella sp. RANM57 TaxID=3425863 RepID=UPI003D6EEE16
MRVADQVGTGLSKLKRSLSKVPCIGLTVCLLFALMMTALQAAENSTSTPVVFAEPSALAQQKLLIDVTTVGQSGRLVAVGDRGHILYSDDGGDTWQQAKVPTRQLLTAVYFVSAKQGWAVGHDALILATTDGGQTWQQQYKNLTTEAPLLDVWFSSEFEGFAVGAYGQILRTSNGGKSWEDWSDHIENEEEFHFNSITGLKDKQEMVIAGEAGTVYYSDNQGMSWQRLESPYEGSLFGVIANGKPHGFVTFGLRGHVFLYDGSLNSWSAIPTHTEQSLFGGQYIADGRLALAGNGGVWLISNDYGQRFSLHKQPDRKLVSGITETADGEYILVGQGGVVQTIPQGNDLAIRP